MPEVPVGVRQHGRWMEVTEFCGSPGKNACREMRDVNFYIYIYMLYIRKKWKEVIITLTIVKLCQGKNFRIWNIEWGQCLHQHGPHRVSFPQNFGIKKTFVRGERWWISSIQRSLHFCWKVKVSGILPKWRRVVKFWFEFGVSRFRLSRYDQSRGWSMSLQTLGSCLCLFVAPDFRTYILT